MQNNFKFTMITLGRKEHHDICFQNENEMKAAHCYHSLRQVRSVDSFQKGGSHFLIGNSCTCGLWLALFSFKLK